MKVTLLQQKGSVEEREFQIELARTIREIIRELSATATFHSFTEGWATITVDGDDSEVVVELLSQAFGLAINHVSNVELHGNYRGVVKSLSASGLSVDIGVAHPKPLFITVKLNTLQAQLADGKQSMSCRTIARNYCIYPGLPISIRVTLCTSNEIEGWLSDSQVSLLSAWISAGLERIQVYNCLPSRLDRAIRRSQLERDIISTMQLSLTVQSILCKIGTDAIGLIPRIGSILRKSQLEPFIPRRIMEDCRPWQNSDVW
jgi:hypothetical protein